MSFLENISNGMFLNKLNGPNTRRGEVTSDDGRGEVSSNVDDVIRRETKRMSKPKAAEEFVGPPEQSRLGKVTDSISDFFTQNTEPRPDANFEGPMPQTNMGAAKGMFGDVAGGIGELIAGGAAGVGSNIKEGLQKVIDEGGEGKTGAAGLESIGQGMISDCSDASDAFLGRNTKKRGHASSTAFKGAELAKEELKRARQADKDFLLALQKAKGIS